MAAGDTALSMALESSPPPPLLDNSPSNLSSPLSMLEASKDGTPDEMDLDLPPSRDGARLDTPEQQEDDEDDDALSQVDSDGESKLSEPDINDSEAETERLYDTPPKNTATRDIVDRPRASSGGQHFLERRRDRNFEPSPSKLQQQVRAEAEAERDASDNESLTDLDDDASVAYSEADEGGDKLDDSRPPSPVKKPPQQSARDSIPNPETPTQDLLDSRKRKRSLAVEQVEVEQPSRKRTGSVGVPDRVFSADIAAIVDDEATLTPLQSGEHTADEAEAGEDETAGPKSKDVPTQSIEDTPRGTSRSKNTKRPAPRKRKGPHDGGGGVDSAHDDGDTATAEEDGQRTAEEEQADVGEETELVHKNEEELERKKAAWEELAAIEKQFTNFRERLYQERLDQLNQEEAMLMSDNPTHPEYLAMKACIDERRDERIRRSTLELKLRMDLLQRKAISERSQIMTQFHQSIRASREKVLEQLGQEWYEIQHERRRFANNIPDYGIRLPATKAQTIRQVVSFNKEVSILSGVAKYQGFPAAPDIRGASDDQVENDFDAITRTRQESMRLHHPHQQQQHQQHNHHHSHNNHRAAEQPPPFREHHQATAAMVGVPLMAGRRDDLGPAGEQFLEQTPWANPNHPAHRQQLDGGVGSAAPLYAGPPVGNRRHSHQPAGGGNNPFLNGELMHKSQSSAGHGHDRLKGAKMGVDMGVKREAVSHVV